MVLRLVDDHKQKTLSSDLPDFNTLESENRNAESGKL
jgi:hypothetical protein